MKKIIGVLGVAMIVATMFFNTNNVNDFNSNTSLTSLVNLNAAHADDEGTGGGITCSTYCSSRVNSTCSYKVVDKNLKEQTITCSHMIKN